MANKPTSSLWLNKYPILEDGHARDLEQAAAINEFHRRQPRHQAEQAAHDDYRTQQHTKAAAHHFAGMRAAQGAGDMEEAKTHGDLFAQHMKAIGLDPYGPVPEHIRLQAADPQHTKVYRFANHGADTLLSHSMSKSEVTKIHGGPIPECPKCGNHDTEYTGMRGKGKDRVCVACNHAFNSADARLPDGPKAPRAEGREHLHIVKSERERLDRLLKAAKLVLALRKAQTGDVVDMELQSDGSYAEAPASKPNPNLPAVVPVTPSQKLTTPAAPAEKTKPPRLHVTDPERYWHCTDCGDYHDVYRGVKDRYGREVGRYRPMGFYDPAQMVTELTERYKDDPAVLEYYGLAPGAPTALPPKR